MSREDDWQLPYSRKAGAGLEIKTGTVIPGVMLTGINSDLPVVAAAYEHFHVGAQADEVLHEQAGGVGAVMVVDRGGRTRIEAAPGAGRGEGVDGLVTPGAQKQVALYAENSSAISDTYRTANFHGSAPFFCFTQSFFYFGINHSDFGHIRLAFRFPQILV